jgi:hypothetical protein
MMPTIRVAHFAFIETANQRSHYYQNYFFGKDFTAVSIPGTASPVYRHAPFEARGSTAALGGDNPALQLLFPHTAFAIAMVEDGEGNRLSKLQLKTVWMASNDISNYSSYTVVNQYTEYYIGVGAAFSDTTIELRFRSAMDSVGASFPAQQLNRQNVGILPLNADLRLQ